MAVMGQRLQDSSVLIIDDDSDLADGLKHALTALGYEVVTAADGLHALAYLRGGGEPSLIILDLQMPTMDGYAFKRAIKADPRWADIPTIVFSAHAERETPEDIVAVVQKTDPAMLLETIQRVMRRS